MHVILDVSRLLFCVQRTSPSGIDRVEMAYARHWMARPAPLSSFVAQSPWGWFGTLSRGQVADLLDALEEVWRRGGAAAAALRRARLIVLRMQARLALGEGRAALARTLDSTRRAVFLLVSHRALDRAEPIAALRRMGARFVPLIHDLIPLTHPEYVRPPQIRRHAARVATVAALADGVISNSTATAEALRLRLAAHRREALPIAVAPLGVERLPLPAAPGTPEEAPSFVCLGTIEPRKNHLLLLHLWRELAARPGAAPPRLLIFGRRGWENENILDLLERCEGLRGPVQEMGPAPDSAVAPALAAARALLLPSFAEGYGLPVAEALALGVPVLCSDLPAFREVGGAVPEFLDPLDGAAWRRMILDYAEPDSAARAAQLDRLRAWRAPDWARHFETVDTLLDTVAGAPAPRPLPGAVPLPEAASALGASPA